MEAIMEIKIKMQDGTELTLSETEARALWTKLNGIFGSNQFITYPIYPQLEPWKPSWSDPLKVTCSTIGEMKS